MSAGGAGYFYRSQSYRSLYGRLAAQCGAHRAARLFAAADMELRGLLARDAARPKEERWHTECMILPRIAVYRALKREFGAEAIALLDESVRVQGEKTGRLLHRITALPGMDRLFLRAFEGMTKTVYSERSGFRLRFYPSPKGVLRFDMLGCIYCRTCAQYGCPELLHTFCDSDVYCYGNLSGISFHRTQTLEHGEWCDFSLALTGRRNKSRLPRRICAPKGWQNKKQDAAAETSQRGGKRAADYRREQG